MRLVTDDRFCVKRNALIRLLLVLGRETAGTKMPRDFTGTFEGVALPARFNYRGLDDGTKVPGTWTVKVYPTPATAGRIKSSRHRTFVVCPGCKNEVPTGRLHQHIHTHSKCQPN